MRNSTKVKVIAAATSIAMAMPCGVALATEIAANDETTNETTELVLDAQAEAVDTQTETTDGAQPTGEAQVPEEEQVSDDAALEAQAVIATYEGDLTVLHKGDAVPDYWLMTPDDVDTSEEQYNLTPYPTVKFSAMTGDGDRYWIVGDTFVLVPDYIDFDLVKDSEDLVEKPNGAYAYRGVSYTLAGDRLIRRTGGAEGPVSGTSRLVEVGDDMAYGDSAAPAAVASFATVLAPATTTGIPATRGEYIPATGSVEVAEVAVADTNSAQPSAAVPATGDNTSFVGVAVAAVAAVAALGAGIVIRRRRR